MKKGLKLLSIAFFSIVLISFVLPLVSAADEVTAAAENIKSFGEGLKTFILALTGASTIPWANVFLAILLFMVVYSIVDVLFDNLWDGWGSAIISFAVASLGMMFWPEGLIETITLQYGVMGATILTIIPFLILLTFTIRIENIMIAKIIWWIYTIYYILFFGYYAIIGLSPDPSVSTSRGIFAAISIVIGGIMIWLLKPLRALLFKQELEEKEEKAFMDIKFRGLGRKIERKNTKALTDVSE